jgi:hypothetical protein
MRAYTAARWVWRHGGSVKEKLAQLGEPALWTRGAVKPADRSEMLRFLCSMVETPQELSLLKNFGEDDIEVRASLLAAAKSIATERGWPWRELDRTAK